MNPTLVRHMDTDQPTAYDLLAWLWTATVAMFVMVLRHFGLVEPEQHSGRHWLRPQRDEFGADEQGVTELHAINDQLGEDREFGRPHGVLLEDTQVFDAIDFADAAPRVAKAYAEVAR